MANKKSKTAKRGKAAKRQPVPLDLQLAAESRSALAATVAWTLSLMATLIAETVGFVCQLYNRFAESNELLSVLGVVMLFVALVAGCITLLLTPLVLKLAKTRPPRLIVQTAYVAGGLPILVLSLQYLAG